MTELALIKTVIRLTQHCLERENCTGCPFSLSACIFGGHENVLNVRRISERYLKKHGAKRPNLNSFIPDIAIRLNIDLDEPFKLRNPSTGLDLQGRLFKFSDSYLLTKVGDEWVPDDTNLNNLLNGNLVVVHLPFIPKVGDTYWTYSGSDWEIVSCTWNNAASERCLLYLGAIFKSKEEAIKERPSVYNQITKEVWKDA